MRLTHMKRIRYGLIVAGMLLCLANSAAAQVSIGIGLSNVERTGIKPSGKGRVSGA